MAKCLVLGANGFIGSHLVDSLVSSGHSVRAFGRFSDNTKKFQTNNSIEIFNGDFLNRNDLETSLKDIEYVFHFISTTTPITADADPLIDVDTNIRMSIQLLQIYAKNSTVKKIIFASTGGAIYGLNSGDSIDEETAPLPISPYAIGKLTIEHYLRYFEKKYGVQSLVYRISNPYGERQSLVHRQGVIPIFLHNIANKKPVTVLGDGSMVRDYIYVKDVAYMISSSFEKAEDNLYNLGSGTGTSINELLEVIRMVTSSTIKVDHKEAPPTFVQNIVLNTSRFRNEFLIEPRTSLREGIQKTWEYIKNSEE